MKAGSELKAVRESLGLSVSDVAKLTKMAGISDYAVRQISKDKDVSTEVLTKVCAALNCEVQDIIDFLPDEIKEGCSNDR